MARIVETDVQTQKENRAKGVLSVEFVETCNLDRIGTVFSLSMEFDDEYNNSKTCFAPGDRAYYRVYASGPYRLGATLGNSFQDSPNVGEEVTEYISLTNFAGSASKPIWSVIRYEWIGKSLGKIKLLKGSNRVFVTEDPDKDGYGVILITYQSRFNRYYHICNQEADVIAYAIELGGWWPGSISDSQLDQLGQDYTNRVSSSESGGTRILEGEDEADEAAPTIQKANLVIQYRNDCDLGENDVTIVVQDAISGQVIQGASVSIDGGTKSGVTGSNGEWYAGKLSTGTHAITVVKQGYQPTAGDMLANDNFEVSAD
jgi:hypothetical protein